MTAKKTSNPTGKGGFQKGKSGNPGGRPKDADDIKKLAKEYTGEAIAKLVEWMRSSNAKASVSACNAILDRGWGKPKQTFDAPEGGKVTLIIEG